VLWLNVVVIAGSPVADVRPFPAGAAAKTIVDLHLELFLGETRKLAQSIVECVKENGIAKSIDEVTGAVLLYIRCDLGVISNLFCYFCRICCYISNSRNID